MRILFLALTLFLISNVSAQTYNGVTLTLRDGSSSIINFTGEHPLIKFADNKLLIITTESTAEFSRTDIVKLNYNEGAGVDNINHNNTSISYNGDAIIFSGLPSNSNLAIYSIDGKLVKSENLTDTNYILPFNSLTQGIYIVTVNGVSTKISISR